jgi:hypothetical protein
MPFSNYFPKPFSPYINNMSDQQDVKQGQHIFSGATAGVIIKVLNSVIVDVVGVSNSEIHAIKVAQDLQSADQTVGVEYIPKSAKIYDEEPI